MGPKGLEGQTKWQFHSVIREVLFSQHTNTVEERLIWQRIFKMNNKEGTGRGPFTKPMEGLAKDR